MKKLTITSGGKDKTFEVEAQAAQAAVTALQQQEPCFTVIVSETTARHFNMRLVSELKVDDVPEPGEAPAPGAATN